MEDGGLWQVCEATVNSSAALLPQHTSMFSCMSASSSESCSLHAAAAATFGHFECCAPPPPLLLPQTTSSPFRSQWEFQYESWMSPARVDELYDMTLIAPSTLLDMSAAGGAAAAFEHAAMSLPQPLPCPQAAAIDLQDLAVGAWGHGMINEAFQSSAEHQQQQGGMMIDQYLHTLNSSSSLPPFNYTNLQEAVEKTLESSLGSVCDKVWNNNNRVTADYHQFGHVMAGADYSLITNPMGSMFHSISTGSLMYLQNKTCCYSEAQVMTKLPPPSQTSLQEIQKAGGPLTLASLPDPSLMKNITSAANDDDDDDASSEVKNYTKNSTVSSVQKQQLQNGNNCHVGNSLVPQPGLYVSSTTAVESSCETLEASKLPAGNQTWTFTETSSEISSSNKTQNSNPPGKVKVCSEEQQQHQNFSNGFQRTPPVDQPVSITKWLPQIVALPPPGPPPLLPLEAKLALPPKCALPPLTVVKCALPRSTNHGRVASNARKRPLWPANTNNMINGSPKKKPIAKWPGVELGCSRLEAVSTLAHHTVTQNTSNYNARALGPALNTNLKPRARQGSANDPQSIAARVRRERISERLKALQLLVPNGDKVDMVTMLEKAINYVQCLELQIRMLKDDTLWPKALGALPNTLQEFLELAGPELATLQEEEQKRKKKRMESVIKEDDPMSSPSPSSDNNTE